MRWYILQALLHKEWLRHAANKGGIVLALLLVCIALILSLGRAGSQGPILGGQVQRCYLIHWCDEKKYPSEDRQLIREWFAFLNRQARPLWTENEFRIRSSKDLYTNAAGNFVLDPNCGCIQVDSRPDPDSGQRRYVVMFRYPGDDPSVIAGYEAWFWKETQRFFNSRRMEKDPEILEERERQTGSPDPRSAMATVLVFCALFFTCVYLLPSFTCEERERGVLLAQALSPASPLEILTAKFLFYPALGMALGALLAGIYRPTVLLLPYFWVALIASAVGSLGIGMTIATLARTQRLASVGAMCYGLVIALFISTLQQINSPVTPFFVLEYLMNKMFHAALTGEVIWVDWLRAVGACLLAAGWICLATVLFRRRGWQ